MELTVYGPLRSATGEKTVSLAVEGSAAEVLDSFLEEYPRAESQLLDSDGDLRPSVRVVRDGESLDMTEECPPDAQLQVFPAMRGG